LVGVIVLGIRAAQIGLGRHWIEERQSTSDTLNRLEKAGITVMPISCSDERAKTAPPT
jgi:hypothetical protein